MKTRRVTLVLDADVAEMLDRLTTPRKKSEFVSALIRNAAQNQVQPDRLAAIQARLDKIEQQLAAANPVHPRQDSG